MMAPSTEWEREGFFGEVVFTNGHVLDGENLTIYYGAADSVICCASLQLSGVLRHLEGGH